MISINCGVVRFGGLRAFHRGLPSAVALGALAIFLGLPLARAQAPQVVSVTPENGATGVATDASIVFVFDQPMDTNVFLTAGLPGLFVGNIELTGAGAIVSVTGSWSADGQTLTCGFVLEFPVNSTIAWTLNPAGSIFPITNTEGEQLATVSGSFTTGTGGGGGGDEDCDGLPDSWGGYSISKSSLHAQNSEADPVPQTPDGFIFGANLSAPDGGAPVTEGSVELPDNSVRDLETVIFVGFWVYSDSATLESELEADYPAGAYVLRFTQEGGPERVINMTMPANNVPVPKILNYNEAQAIDAAQDFTLEWNSFNTADADDYLFISVHDEESGELVFQAPDYCPPTRELPVTATSVVIPAETFVDGRLYSATLSFGRFFYASTNDVPDMGGSGGMSRITTFTMRAGSVVEPADPATLSGFQLLENGNPQFELTGTAGQVYTIERTEDLTPTVVWTEVGTVTMDGAGQGVFEDDIVGETSPLFYRAVAE